MIIFSMLIFVNVKVRVGDWVKVRGGRRLRVMVKRRYETDVANWIVSKEDYRRRVLSAIGRREAELKIENFTLDPSKWVLIADGRREERGEAVIRRIMEEDKIDVYEYRKHNPKDFSQPPAWIVVRGKKVERIF